MQAFRSSYQYISFKQKLIYSFEDQDDALQLIFKEFLLFSQKVEHIFPKSRFEELLRYLTKP